MSDVFFNGKVAIFRWFVGRLSGEMLCFVMKSDGKMGVLLWG